MSPPSSTPSAAPYERPRERLLRLGPRALTIEELVALVLGSGQSGRSALRLAREIVAEAERGGAQGMARLSASRLAALPGLGPASAARVVASVELGRRLAARVAREEQPRIRGPEDVHRRMAPQLRDLPHEEFHALYLNRQHAVVRETLVTRGILDASLIHPREVFRPAVEAGAAAVILVHNHPSGDPTPSAEDRAVTRQLEAAGRTLGIPVLDHVVVAANGWRSAQGGGNETVALSRGTGVPSR